VIFVSGKPALHVNERFAELVVVATVFLYDYLMKVRDCALKIQTLPV